MAGQVLLTNTEFRGQGISFLKIRILNDMRKQTLEARALC